MIDWAAFRALVLGAALLGGIPTARAGDDGAPPPLNVVLVHGFHNTSAIFDPLVGRLEKLGCRCYAPSLQPNDVRLGVRDLTLKLAAGIDAHFGRSKPLVIVAFSIGGLITRDYVQNLGGQGRVRAVFMISTPNRGTLWAGLSPSSGARQLAPGSRFLDALNADLSVWKTIPVYAYWTPLDLVILPSTNTRCSFGHTRRILCLLHPWMVRNPEVMADITARIGGLAAAPPGDVPSFADTRNGR